MRSAGIFFWIFFLNFSVVLADPNKKAKSIVDEGKLLYRSEIASWLGTDIFLENYKTRDSIGGYFSYPLNEKTFCVFYSRSKSPEILGTIIFDENPDVNKAGLDMHRRPFSPIEESIYQLRSAALHELKTDSYYQRFQNTNLNLVPIISGKLREVYVLTGPTTSGTVIFGNDYLLIFNTKNQLRSRKRLHKNIIPISYGDKNAITTMHTHLPETGELITATDICTLMLYEHLAGWKNHEVIGSKYVNIWDCHKDQLVILKKEALQKITDHVK